MPPASVDLTEAARSVQLFKINDFTVTKEKPGYTTSRMCAVGGYDWRIEFHPKSHNAGYGNDWIMFRVRLINRGASGVAASFSCCLMDPSSPGTGSSYSYSYSDPPEEIITSSMFHENHSLEIFLIRREHLEGSRRKYVKDDCILVQCAINVLPGEPKVDPVAKTSLRSVPSSDLHQQFGELLQSQKGADVTFLVAGEPIAAHRSVLFVGDDDMKENAPSCVEVKSMDVEVFRAMLCFVYTDMVPELDRLKGEKATAMARHLLEAADQYGLKRLKRICMEKICTTIDVDNVATTLAVAERHGCLKLNARCMKFTLANLGVVSGTQGYKHLEASCPSVLTELLKLMVEGHE